MAVVASTHDAIEVVVLHAGVELTGVAGSGAGRRGFRWKAPLESEAVVRRVHPPIRVEDEVVGVPESRPVRSNVTGRLPVDVVAVVTRSVEAASEDICNEDRRAQRLFAPKARELLVTGEGRSCTGVPALSDVELSVGPEVDLVDCVVVRRAGQAGDDVSSTSEVLARQTRDRARVGRRIMRVDTRARVRDPDNRPLPGGARIDCDAEGQLLSQCRDDPV